MGFVLSVLYFLTNYLTPPTLFGQLAVVRVELVLAVLIFFVSIPKLTGSIILKTPQSLAVVGLAFAGSFSVFFGLHWAWKAVEVFPEFLPCAFAYFLVSLYCNSKKRLQVIIFMLLFVCLFVIARGSIELLSGVPESVPQQVAAARTTYILAMRSSTGELLYRLRGLGLINDPNDFGQLLVCVIPLMFIFWRYKMIIRNLVLVILPVSALLYGTFLTHSRGALLALMAIAVMAARRRIGTLPALLLATGIFVAAMGLQFTGGRDISANAGADRTALWSSGLQMLKSHPLFGVGLGGFADNCDGCGHTAHNSLVVCAAELGMFGLYFWCLFLYPTIRNAMSIASPEKVSDGRPILIEKYLLRQAASKVEALDKAEVNQMGRLLILSFTGLLVTGWFLSRPYILTFFLLGGMVEAVFEMALRRGMVAPRQQMVRVLQNSGILAVSLILLMYIVLRIANLMR